MGKIWLIASGKGGVGKSTIAGSLAMALADMGSRVCVIDADIGLRDQDAILGLENSVVYDLMDVACRGCSLSQALISPPDRDRLSLLPSSQFARSKDLPTKAYERILSQLKEDYDWVLIDGPAGIERGLRSLFSEQIDEVLLVCTPDDVCLRDAERVIQLLGKKEMPRPKLVVNRLDPTLIRIKEMMSASVIAQSLDVELFGEIPEDSMVYRALLKHIRLMDVDCSAAQAITRIAKRMSGETVPLFDVGSESRSFFRRVFPKRLKEVKLVDR